MLLASLILAGCSSQSSPVGVTPPPAEPAHYSKETPEVGLVSRSPLFMTHLNLKNRYDVLQLNARLYLGDEVDRSSEIFSTPPKAYDVNDLPVGWKDADLRATGWQASAESFGAILKRDRVAFAMFSVEHAEEQLLDRIAQDYEDELGNADSKVNGKVARYRFWDHKDQSLMVSSVQTPRYGVVVTVSMGVKSIMNLLRMDPKDADEDAAKAQKLTAAGVPADKAP